MKPLFLSLLVVTTSLLAVDPDPAAATPKPQKLLPQTPEGFTFQVIEVAEYPEHTVELFVYVPKGDGAWPCILDIHGGGWRHRHLDRDRPMMERLAQRGFVTALVSYRLSNEAKYPAALHDCKAALRCLRAHAKELKIDPERIGCMGGSAGGHLCGLTAMTIGVAEFEGDGPFKEQSSAVKAAIVMAGTQDLVASNSTKTPELAVLFFGSSAQENPELYKAASPITYVRAGVPPTIFIEAENDSIQVGRAQMMAKLKALGIETSVHTLKDAPHPFWQIDPWCAEAVEIAAAFFKRHLGEPVPK